MNRRIARNHAQVAIPFVALVLLGTIPVVIGAPRLLHLATLVLLWSMWGISLNIIWGYAGQISLAHHGIGAIAAYSMVLLAQQSAWQPWFAAGSGLVMAVAASVVVAAVTARASGFYFAIMTLALGGIVVDIMTNWRLAGRSTGLIVSDSWLPVLGLGGLNWDVKSRDGGFYLMLLAVIVVMLALLHRTLGTDLGRSLLAIREDAMLAKSLGVNVGRYRAVAFGLSALVAGVAGQFHALYIQFISPLAYQLDAVLTVILLLVIGGRGSLWGPVLGAVVYVGLFQALPYEGPYRSAVFGFGVILVMLAFPSGLAGLPVKSVSKALSRVLERPERGNKTGPEREVPEQKAEECHERCNVDRE